jgi:hypothetical protein
MKTYSALGLAVGVLVAGIAIYAVRVGLAEDPAAEQLRPEVDGRLVLPIFGTTIDGSNQIKCEFDALVGIEGQTVVNVNAQGTSADVRVGDKIAELMYEPPQPGAVSQLEMGPLGQRQGNVRVYWGKDGALHAGCAPESIKTENGVSAPLGERP